MWEDVQHSTRSVCDILRTLAHGDSSVALVCAMRPAVLSFWLASPKAAAPFQPAWDTQRRHLFETAREGAWWGTITSEPGSGGDLAKTAAVARPAATDGHYLLTGQKQPPWGLALTRADGRPEAHGPAVGVDLSTEMQRPGRTT